MLAEIARYLGLSKELGVEQSPMVKNYGEGSIWRQKYPTVLYLRERARRRIPHFAFEYADGGAGSGGGIANNARCLDEVELVPRYGVMPDLPSIGIELFGRKYSAPFGIAPIGLPSLIWPGAERYLARAAQKAKIPYTLGMVAGLPIEDAAKLAPDVLWFQMYRMARDNHALGIDMMKRAESSGVHTICLTLDTPVRSIRPREAAAGLGGKKVRLSPRKLYQMVTSPRWLGALLRNGQPKFANLKKYVGENASANELVAFARKEVGGAFTWDEVSLYREKWRSTLIVKGILHPADAERAISIGVDGILVSNHGGRQMEGLPASIDVLPAIARQVNRRAVVLMDSGIRSGVDVVRAVASGADAVFAGKAFLWGLGALGEDGPDHVIDVLFDETRAALGQIGAHSFAAARNALNRL